MKYACELIFARKLSSMFPGKEEQVQRIFSDCGREEHEEISSRVKLAVLKLSGGDIEKVREYVQTAVKDYRDVLAWAEYPEQMRVKSWELSPEENREIQARDLDQYESWLRE
jgi:hypothetical protein